MAPELDAAHCATWPARRPGLRRSWLVHQGGERQVQHENRTGHTQQEGRRDRHVAFTLQSRPSARSMPLVLMVCTPEFGVPRGALFTEGRGDSRNPDTVVSQQRWIPHLRLHRLEHAVLLDAFAEGPCALKAGLEVLQKLQHLLGVRGRLAIIA